MSPGRSRIAPFTSTSLAPQQVAQQIEDSDELFHYTSGRWVYAFTRAIQYVLLISPAADTTILYGMLSVCDPSTSPN